MTEAVTPARLALWIFCRVVDNFGDAGVCWRLARQLAAEHRFDPTLVIDKPDTLASIEPRLGKYPDCTRTPALLDGVRIVSTEQWASAPLEDSPSVVLSAFGCELPGWLRERLAGAPARPLWIHLEYLSAEPWVESHHGLVSVKSSDAAREHFIYPGFTVQTAGLLRESGVAARRDAFRCAGRAAGFLQRFNGGPSAEQLSVSLFCYESAPIEALLARLAAGPSAVLLYAAGGCADAALGRRYGRLPAPGERLGDGKLQVIRLPMLSQDDYDHLLWSCAVNFVRGEDSWIRAHWADAPFIWQAYPQAESAHLDKLEAFLGRMHTAQPKPEAFAPVAGMMRAWNAAPDSESVADAWSAFSGAIDKVSPGYRAWVRTLEEQPDLASQLARYCLDRL
jgi:uncharacterized repeat protein (TIGR03837 family)